LDPKSDIAEVPIRIGGGPYAYITNEYENTASVIDTATNTVTATIPVGSNPIGVAVSLQMAQRYMQRTTTARLSL
jgi:YVTN family beta-propeller protein